MTACMLLVCQAYAFALNPNLDVSQYAHTSWRIRDGFPAGTIRAMTQAADGYLWLGTEFGLFRFDGVRAVQWNPPARKPLPSTNIRSLWWAPDGRLWIGTSRGLVSWDGRELTHYPELDGLNIEVLLEDRERTVWVVAGFTLSEARLCRIVNGKTQCYGEDGGAGAGVTTIYLDSGGTLWAGAMTGVWRWKPGPPKFFPIAGLAQRTYALLENDDGGILIARRDGITKLKNGSFEPYSPAAGLQFPSYRLFRDRNGSVWVGAVIDRGLLHIHQGKTDVFTQADGLSGNNVSSFFEDREGNVWVSTEDGLDRFREFTIATFSIRQGVSSRSITSVHAAKDRGVWLGTSDGLNRWTDEDLTIYRRRASRGGTREVPGSGLPDDAVYSVFEDEQRNLWAGTLSGVAILNSDGFHAVAGIPSGNFFSIAGDGAGNVWISHDTALFHVRHERVVERLPWASFGRKAPARALLHDSGRDGLWIGFLEGGVAFYQNNQLRASYAGPQGLGGGRVQSLYRDDHGALWAATQGGLSRIQDGRILTLTSRNGLPCDTVHWMMDDDAGSAWLFMACGLVRIARPELDAWAAEPGHTLHPTVFDSFDGIRNHPMLLGLSPLVAKAADGKLWFLNADGVAIIDPHALSTNTAPPPVHIEQITADDKIYDATNGLRLPARTRNLTIDYTALSLAAPEKMRFRYVLEGQDPDWKEVINDRQVQYSNLPPGSYRFRVVASNNSGVWNETGAMLGFSITPAFYQTRWFQAAMAFSFVALLWAAYQWRVAQLARQFNRTLDARVSERTRIARELHDTLLQSFHGLLLQFQTAAYLLPERPAEAREQLDGAIVHAAKAITEGRNAVQGLRSSTLERNDLAIAIRTLGDALASDASAPTAPDFSVAVEGETRDLHPIVRDEIYKIAAEALRNAFRHAHAARVEVEIRYDDEQFRLRVRDDGTGIDPKVLANHGLEGHYGLRGMPERAALIDGKLAVWSEAGAGTEVELCVPAGAIYAASRRPSWWSRLFASRTP